jgi:neutral ceramidase
VDDQEQEVVTRLKAGVAEAEITCQVGTELAAELNPRVSQGVRTPLMAKALVLSNGAESLAIVTLDLFGLQPDAAERLAQSIGERSGLRPDAVMVFCSHTRGAPYTTPVVGWPGVNDPYVADVVERVPGVVVEAQARLEEASLGMGRAVLPHLVYNHRLETRNMKTISAWMGIPRDEVLQPEGPTDPEFSVLVVRDTRGRPFCLLWSIAADNRFAQDRLISADLPYAVQRELDARLGRRVVSMCLPGCAGNISFRYGLGETADAVASAVMAVQLETPCDPMIRLASRREKMLLPIRDYSQFWSQWDIELKYPQALEAYAQEVALLQSEGAQAVATSVQAFRLGRFALVGLPGMPFVEFALEIKEQSPFQRTLVASNAGGYVGYLITQAAFERGGFEAWPARSARVGPGGGEFVAERALGLLQSLARF